MAKLWRSVCTPFPLLTPAFSRASSYNLPFSGGTFKEYNGWAFLNESLRAQASSITGPTLEAVHGGGGITFVDGSRDFGISGPVFRGWHKNEGLDIDIGEKCKNFVVSGVATGRRVSIKSAAPVTVQGKMTIGP